MSQDRQAVLVTLLTLACAGLLLKLDLIVFAMVAAFLAGYFAKSSARLLRGSRNRATPTTYGRYGYESRISRGKRLWLWLRGVRI